MTPPALSNSTLADPDAPQPRSTSRSVLRKWLAIGTGVGIEIGATDLRVVAVRVRPSGARVLGAVTLARFREQPAGVWGDDYAAFLRGLGLSHLTATVLLPRRETIVRQISVPGVEDRDLDSAVRLQLDTLHPYPEEEAVAAWVRIGRTPAVLIAITRRAVLEQYTERFAEAGVKVSGFTVSAAALYSAAHLIFAPPAEGFLAACERDGELEVYGESPTYPVLSATLDPPAGRALEMAMAELRLRAGQPPLAMEQLLPAPAAGSGEILGGDRYLLPYAAALAGAAPRLAMRLNLLPEEQRAANSRAMYIPTLALGSLCLLMTFAAVLYSALAARGYDAELQSEVTALEPLARRSADLDREIETARRRILLLDDFKRRSKSDLDALNELTRLLPPPTWVSAMELTRSSVRLSGESDQAAGLLKILDGSPMFQNSQFTLGLVHVITGETFNIRSERRGAEK